MKRLSLIVGFLTLATTMLVSPTAVAQGEGGQIAPNSGPTVMITISVGKLDTDAVETVRTYRMAAQDKGPRGHMLMGWRMPIPTESEAGGETPTFSYIYQNVGVTAGMSAEILADGRILLQGEMEVSGIREKAGVEGDQPDMPIIGTFQQAVSVVLQDGKGLRVAQAPDPDGGSLFLELQADVLK